MEQTGGFTPIGDTSVFALHDVAKSTQWKKDVRSEVPSVAPLISDYPQIEARPRGVWSVLDFFAKFFEKVGNFGGYLRQLAQHKQAIQRAERTLATLTTEEKEGQEVAKAIRKLRKFKKELFRDEKMLKVFLVALVVGFVVSTLGIFFSAQLAAFAGLAIWGASALGLKANYHSESGPAAAKRDAFHQTLQEISTPTDET